MIGWGICSKQEINIDVAEGEEISFNSAPEAWTIVFTREGFDWDPPLREEDTKKARTPLAKKVGDASKTKRKPRSDEPEDAEPSKKTKSADASELSRRLGGGLRRPPSSK